MEGMTIPTSTTVRVIMVILMMSAITFQCASAAVNHTVGDSSGWDLSSNISIWSSSTSFFVNDSLVFNYTPDHDVIEVTKFDFAACRITSPISTYDDDNGQTVILLSQPGPRYFICGRPRHCSMGLKLSVQVLYQQNPLDQAPQSNSTAAQPVQPGGTPTEGGGYGDHDQRGPHVSRSYSNLNAVTSSRYLVITIMAIMCAFCLC